MGANPVLAGLYCSQQAFYDSHGLIDVVSCIGLCAIHAPHWMPLGFEWFGLQLAAGLHAYKTVFIVFIKKEPVQAKPGCPEQVNKNFGHRQMET